MLAGLGEMAEITDTICLHGDCVPGVVAVLDILCDCGGDYLDCDAGESEGEEVAQACDPGTSRVKL